MLNTRGASLQLARGSRRAKGAPRRETCQAPPIRHGTAVTPSPPGKGGQCPHPARQAEPASGARLGCAPSVILRARGADLQLARRPGSRRVGSAHSRRAIGLVPFGHAAPAWSCPAACAEARRTKGAPGLRGSRRTKDAPRRTACAAPPIRHGFRRDTFPAGEGFFCAPSASVERGGVLLRRPTEAAQAMRRVWQDAAFPPGCIGNDRRAANTTGHQK